MSDRAHRPTALAGLKRPDLSRVLGQAAWAVALGAVSGLACVAARLTFRLLQWCFTGNSGLLPTAAAGLPVWRRVLVPIAGALCAWLVLNLVRRFAQPGPPTDYVEAVRDDGGVVPFAPTFWRTAAAAFSLATGAAVGREGAMIQFAAASTSWVAQRRGGHGFSVGRQVACGAAAALATAYQAPVAGVLFAIEVVLGRAGAGQWLLLSCASLSGWLVGRMCLGAGPLFAAPGGLGPMGWGWAWLLPLAAFAGLVGPLYQRAVRCLGLAQTLPVALAWGGLTVGLLSWIEPRVWGNGDQALLGLLRVGAGLAPTAGAVAVLLALRMLATSVCVGVGTIGGVFTPTLFAGAALGLLAARAAHATTPLIFVVIAMGALLASVTHAPWMATAMAVELTGRWELAPVLLVCNLLAWRLARRLSPETLYGIATTRPGGRARERPSPRPLGLAEDPRGEPRGDRALGSFFAAWARQITRVLRK